jgi:hypothetical protein
MELKAHLKTLENRGKGHAADREPRRSRMVLAVGREASGVAFGDSMMGIGRVTGWLTPFRYEEDRREAAWC